MNSWYFTGNVTTVCPILTNGTPLMERYQCAVMHDQCGGKASLTNSVLSFHSFGQLITMTMSTDNLHLWKTKPKLILEKK
ncbi:hypothetical protein BLOT_004772 [Blomia tropicalis]|nr:hypothetical protein BLOT_004772 [Blomia tropicalis]